MRSLELLRALVWLSLCLLDRTALAIDGTRITHGWGLQHPRTTRTSSSSSSASSTSIIETTTATTPRLVSKTKTRFGSLWTNVMIVRGGYSSDVVDDTDAAESELSEKVRKAMIKLGLAPPTEDASNSKEEEGGRQEEAGGGVCEVELVDMEQQQQEHEQEQGTTFQKEATGSSTMNSEEEEQEEEQDAHVLAAQLSAELQVDESLCMAALGATALVDSSNADGRRKFQVEKARELLQQELDRIGTVGESSTDVQQLVSEGHSIFLSRRALAFADGNLDDARAILVADQMDEQQEKELEQQQKQQTTSLESSNEASASPPPPQLKEEDKSKEKPPPEEPMKTVTVNSNFDPTQQQQQQQQSPKPKAAAASAAVPQGMPQPAKKSDVVFEATAAQIQKLVLESPVPVLLDIYADWCGPCKVLTPALEEMAIKSGGAFRLVKVNTDKEKAVSSTACLNVNALPTVFGIRNGKILNMFQGMPRSEAMMKSFMMGLLVSESNFDPPVTAAEKKQYAELTAKLIKMAGLASFPFSARERLQDRVMARLDELLTAMQEVNGAAVDFVECDESVSVIKSLLSNIIKDPSSMKFRTINLANKVIASKLARFPPCLAILKSVGFTTAADSSSTAEVQQEQGGGETLLVLGEGKKIVNVAPLMIARDCIDKWVDKSRYELAKAARKRRDEEDRARLQLERDDDEYEEEYDDEDEEVRDPNACTLKVRFDGKNKIHELVLDADEPLSAVLDRLSIDDEAKEDVQVTCIAKRLTISSSDMESMGKSLRTLGLFPSSYLVVKVGKHTTNGGAKRPKKGADVTSLSARAAAKQKRKKGSHTMQSVGIYAKDDNNKAELIDGGGGVWYEHDVTDDEEEQPNAKGEEEVAQEATNDAEETSEGQGSESAQDSEDDYGED